MADVTSPFGFPYPEDTDLVRDWPDLSEDVADAVAAGLDAAGSAGIGSNVVQTVKTDVFTTTSTSLTAVTGLAATITPSSATSKVLIILSLMATNSEPGRSINVDIDGGNASAYIGDANGSRRRGIFGTGSADSRQSHSIVGAFLDSPATGSPVTYQVRVCRTTASGSAIVNRMVSDSNDEQQVRGASTLTLIEVAV